MDPRDFHLNNTILDIFTAVKNRIAIRMPHKGIKTAPINRVPTAAPIRSAEDHFETLEQVYEDRFSRQYGFWRNYVRQVIYRYLDCGILHNGFARVRCGECGHEFLLAYSCKRRHPRLRWGKLLPILSSKAGGGVWGMAL